MDSSSPKLTKETNGSATQRKLRRSSLALAGVNKNTLSLSECNEMSSPGSNTSSEKSGKSSGFSLFGLFTRKKADSEAELLKKDDSFSTFSTEECSSPSYSFSSADNKVLEDVPKRRFSLGLDSRPAPTPILLVNGSPIKISAKRQSMSLVNAPADRKSTKVKSIVEERTSTSVDGAISFRNPVMLFSGGRRSQTDQETGTDSEVLSNSFSNPDDEDEVDEEEEEMVDEPLPTAGGKRRSSVTLTVPAALLEAKGTTKAKYYFMRRSISLKTNPLDEDQEEHREGNDSEFVSPPQDVPSSPSKAKFVLWQSVDAEEEEAVSDAPSVIPERPFETVVHDGRRLSVRAVSVNAPPAPAPPKPVYAEEEMYEEEEKEVIPEVTVVQAPDGRRLSVRAVSANAPPAPGPPAAAATVVEGADGRRLSVRALSLNAPPAPAPPRRDSERNPAALEQCVVGDAEVTTRRVSVGRAVTEGAPAAPAPPPGRASIRVAPVVASIGSDSRVAGPTSDAEGAFIVQSPDGRRLSVRAVTAGAPPAPTPPKRDSLRVDCNSIGTSSVDIATVMSPEGRRLSVRALTDNAPPAPAPPKRDSLRVVPVADQTAVGVAPPHPAAPGAKRLSVNGGGDEAGMVQISGGSGGGRRLSIGLYRPMVSVSTNAVPTPAPPAVRGSLRLSEDEKDFSVVQSGDGRRLSVRAVSENAPPAPAPPRR